MVQPTLVESQIVVLATTRPSDGIAQWVGATLTFFSCAAFVTFVCLIVYFFYLVRNHRQQKQEINVYSRLNQRRTLDKFGGTKNHARSKTVSAISQTPNRASKPSCKVSTQLETKLLTLLNYDWGVAERLLSQVMIAHPGKPEQWYWEKVIWDLERDRH